MGPNARRGRGNFVGCQAHWKALSVTAALYSAKQISNGIIVPMVGVTLHAATVKICPPCDAAFCPNVLTTCLNLLSQKNKQQNKLRPYRLISREANLSINLDVSRRNDFDKVLVHDWICTQKNSVSTTVNHDTVSQVYTPTSYNMHNKMQLEMADFASGAATWQTRPNDDIIRNYNYNLACIEPVYQTLQTSDWWTGQNICIVRYDTIRYGRLTCTQKLIRWPA